MFWRGLVVTLLARLAGVAAFLPVDHRQNNQVTQNSTQGERVTSGRPQTTGSHSNISTHFSILFLCIVLKLHLGFSPQYRKDTLAVPALGLGQTNKMSRN